MCHVLRISQVVIIMKKTKIAPIIFRDTHINNSACTNEHTLTGTSSVFIFTETM